MAIREVNVEVKYAARSASEEALTKKHIKICEDNNWRRLDDSRNTFDLTGSKYTPLKETPKKGSRMGNRTAAKGKGKGGKKTTEVIPAV